MAWNGQVPTDANWQGNPQFPGSEELYTTPSPATTATNPSIGIVDGNVIPLPTAYNTLNVATLTSTNINNSGTITTAIVEATTGNVTTINSTTINNSGNIQTATINGLTPSTIANTWSLFPAVSDVIALQTQATQYVPLQFYTVGTDASLGSPVYTNYECAIAGATMNPLQRLDPWQSGHTYVVDVDWGCLYNGVEYITIANNVGDVLPTNTSYFRPANYDNAYGYSADDIVYQPTGISPGWYQSDFGSTGVAPPNLFAWTPINFWGLAPVLPDPAWDIKGFKDVQSASVHTDELVVANQTTLGDGGDALVVNGGTTLDGGALHGTTIGSLPVSGINTVRLDVLPAGIEMTSITGILMNSTLATEIGAGGGLVLTAGGAASLSAGGAVSIAGGDYIEYNTDENRFINTTSGNDFTDIKVGNIFPAHDGSANLRINGGGSGRGVEIADGVTINTQSLTSTNILNYATTDTQLLKVAQSTFLPAAYDGGVTYYPNMLVMYAGLPYFAIQNTTGNDPTDQSYWRLAEWDSLYEYNTGDLVLVAADFNFFISLTGTNLGNDPVTTLGTNWDYYYGETYGLTRQGVQFKAQTGDTILRSIVKEVGDPNVYLMATSGTNVDILKLKLFTSPATEPLDLNQFELQNVNTITSSPDYNGTIAITTPLSGTGGLDVTVGGSVDVFGGDSYLGGGTIDGDINLSTGNNLEFKSTNGGSILINNNIAKFITRPDNRNITISAGKNGEFSSVGSLVLNSSTGGTTLSAQTNIDITSAAGTVSLTAGAGQNVNVNRTLNLANNNVINANTITGQTNLTLQSTGTNSIRLYPASGFIECNRPILMGGASGIFQVPTISANNTLSLETGGGANNQAIVLNNNNITGANTITGTGALTLATTGATNLNLSPASTGLIVATKGLNMSNNNITNANTITGQGALTLASGTNTNIILSPAGTGVISATKVLNMTTNNIINCRTITSDTDLTLNGGTGNSIIALKNLNMSNLNINNANTITGQTTLTLATTTNGSLNLSPDGAGTIIANKSINMLNNSIGAVNTITGNTSLTLASASNGNIAINPDGTGSVIMGKQLLMGSNGISQVPSITSSVSLSLNTGGGANNQPINFNNNALTNVLSINGRNLFAYGNFYNTANQTLGAINTATRVNMNTSLNNNLITLDSVTNIGRLTFTNAGVYHVVWNAYLLHGSGGATKSVIWIRLNGTDVAGSGKTENNDSQLNETNLTSSSMVSVTAGQYIEFYWAADSLTVPLTSVAASAPYPATPSFSCTISIVG